MYIIFVLFFTLKQLKMWMIFVESSSAKELNIFNFEKQQFDVKICLFVPTYFKT